MGDITLDPIPQESDTCSSFDQLGPRHVLQRSVGEVTLDPSAIQRVQREQLLSIRDRIKESEAKWHEVSDAYMHNFFYIIVVELLNTQILRIKLMFTGI